MYKQVLLAYDGSLECVRALREGALLAKRCGAEVHLLCVVAVSELLVADCAYGGAVAHQHQDYKGLLETAAKRLKDMGIRTHARIVEGEPTPTIAAVAKEISADLVVVAHHTEGFLSRWWSGSQQDYLTDHLGCSFLIARTPMSDEVFEAECAKLVAA